MYMFLIGKSKDLPPLPKKERYLTAQELKDKWVRDWGKSGRLYKVTAINTDMNEVFLSGWTSISANCWLNIEDMVSDEFKLEDGSPLLVEDWQEICM